MFCKSILILALGILPGLPVRAQALASVTAEKAETQMGGDINIIGPGGNRVAAQQASGLARPKDATDTVISVRVVGFGEPDEEQKKKLRKHSSPSGI